MKLNIKQFKRLAQYVLQQSNDDHGLDTSKIMAIVLQRFLPVTKMGIVERNETWLNVHRPSVEKMATELCQHIIIDKYVVMEYARRCWFTRIDVADNPTHFYWNNIWVILNEVAHESVYKKEFKELRKDDELFETVLLYVGDALREFKETLDGVVSVGGDLEKQVQEIFNMVQDAAIDRFKKIRPSDLGNINTLLAWAVRAYVYSIAALGKGYSWDVMSAGAFVAYANVIDGDREAAEVMIEAMGQKMYDGLYEGGKN